MTESINLRDLAVDRQDQDTSPGIRHQRHFITRYLLPGFLVLGFVGVLAWALQDRFLPARKVLEFNIFRISSDLLIFLISFCHRLRNLNFSFFQVVLK